MKYKYVLDLRIAAILVLCTILLAYRPAYVQAQTEGDTGYEYNEAYDEYDEESGIEPNFDVPIVNVTVVAGQTAVLPCSIEDLGRYKVAWLDQNNMPLTYDDRRIVDDIRFSVVRPYIKEWNLQIRDIRWEDQGQYKCTINTQPPKSKSVVLHVKVPAQIIDELSTNDVTVQEGDTVVLVCNVTGVPRPEVTWYRRPASSNINDRESKMCKPHTLGPGIGHVGEVIIIKNVSRYCDDIYECVADNGVPPAVSRQMRVTVEFAPEITMPNRRISQERGKDTILECIITAFPHAMNYWEKDGRELTSSSGSTSGKYRVQPYDEGEHTITLSLRIHNIDATDFGEYRCVASNSLGTDTESMWLYEYKAPSLDQYENPKNIAPVNWLPYTTTRATEPKPSYDFDRYNSNKNEDWERSHNTPIGKSDKLSSSTNPISRASCYVIISVYVIFSAIDSHLLYGTTL